MAITFIEARKRQKKLIWVLIIVIFLTLIVLWLGFFKKPFLDKTEKPRSAFELKKVQINFEVLENPTLKELQPFEKIKPYQGETGRENPFLPY